MEHHRPADLARLIHPRSIALVGASERAGSIGERTLTNLLTHSELAGPLCLVNPSRAEPRGQRCWPSVAARPATPHGGGGARRGQRGWPSVAALPATPDVVVVAVPASGVLAVIGDCAARGVAFAVILSSGF